MSLTWPMFGELQMRDMTTFSLGFMKSLYLKEYKNFPKKFSLVFTIVILRVCSLVLKMSDMLV